MNKVQGLISDFALIRTEGTRIALSYGLEAIDEEKATWVEVYLPKKKNPMLTLDMVKKAIIDDINARTDEKILSGFVWNGKPVWLSSESQTVKVEGTELNEVLYKFLASRDSLIMILTDLPRRESQMILEGYDHDYILHTLGEAEADVRMAMDMQPTYYYIWRSNAI